jgi:hypothetical protein
MCFSGYSCHKLKKYNKPCPMGTGYNVSIMSMAYVIGCNKQRYALSRVNILLFCMIGDFHSGDYEECHLLGCYAMWLL